MPGDEAVRHDAEGVAHGGIPPFLRVEGHGQGDIADFDPISGEVADPDRPDQGLAAQLEALSDLQVGVEIVEIGVERVVTVDRG